MRVDWDWENECSRPSLEEVCVAVRWGPCPWLHLTFSQLVFAVLHQYRTLVVTNKSYSKNEIFHFLIQIQCIYSSVNCWSSPHVMSSSSSPDPSSKPWYVVLPHSRFRLVWDAVLSIILAIMAFYSEYYYSSASARGLFMDCATTNQPNDRLSAQK